MCQSNELERDIKHKTGGKVGANQKFEGIWPTQPPPRTATVDNTFFKKP